MKYEAQLKRVVRCEREALSPDLSALLDADPAFRAEFEVLRRTEQIVSLKRYETPDPHVEIRVAARVREAVAQLPAPAFRPVWIPRLSYGLAALAVGVIGLYLAAPAQFQVGSRDMPDPAYGLARQAPQETPPGELPPPARSNIAPSGVQYGPAPSVLVEFEY